MDIAQDLVEVSNIVFIRVVRQNGDHMHYFTNTLLVDNLFLINCPGNIFTGGIAEDIVVVILR